MKRLFVLWIALVLFAVFPSDLPAQTTLPSADLPLSPELAWRDAIERIEAARFSGRLTTDQGARNRLWALADPTRLPPEFQPTAGTARFAAEGEDLHDGLQELAEMLDALFVDQADWSAETRMAILAEFEEGERQYRAALAAALPATELTEHFAIHWDDTGGPDAPRRGFNYIETLGEKLEDAWKKLEEEYGYQMPDPADFGKAPDSKGISRFDVFVVRDPIKIMGDVCDIIKICEKLKLQQPQAMTLPGDMNFKNDIPELGLDTLAAHELFHMLQWNYAGFRDSTALGKAEALFWYAGEASWLMESTATWIEDEIYPNDNDYRHKIHQYTKFPDVSLFASWSELIGRPPQFHDYGAVVFIKFLQEHLAANAGYNPTRDIVRDIWENVPLQGNSTVEAVTYVLMHPPSGASPYEDYIDTWHSIFDDFAVANYLKDYDDGPDWPTSGRTNASVKIEQDEYPSANPPIAVTRHLLGFEGPGAQYVEILPTRLGLPGGTDATGAKLHLEFSTSCPTCTLDALTFAGGTPARTPIPLTLSGSDGLNLVFSGSADLATNFGAAGGVTKAALVFSNGPEEVFLHYDYTITATDNSPESPTHLTATAGANALRDRWIQLQWDQVREAGVTYSVYRSQTSPVPIDNAHRIASGLLSRSYRDRGISWETTYFYVVTAVDRGRNSSSPSGEASAQLVLFDNVQVTPNPFTPNGDGVDDATNIAYTLLLPPRERSVNVSAEILDAGGNLVQRLPVQPPLQGRGGHSVTWDGGRLDGTTATAGLYTFRITARSTSGRPPVVVSRSGEVQLVRPDGIFTVTVKGSDAIFLAGRTDLVIPPASDPWPGGLIRHGSPTPEEIQETLPPFIPVSGGDVIRATDPAIGGVSFYNGFGVNVFGPSGNGLSGSNLSPFGGISGYRGPQGPLSGVFLDDTIPVSGPQPTLDFSPAGLGINFPTLSPALGQVFYIGDGVTSGGIFQEFIAPVGATRLFLGIPDGFGFNGGPGAYDDNDGFYQIRIERSP